MDPLAAARSRSGTPAEARRRIPPGLSFVLSGEDHAASAVGMKRSLAARASGVCERPLGDLRVLDGRSLVVVAEDRRRAVAWNVEHGEHVAENLARYHRSAMRREIAP